MAFQVTPGWAGGMEGGGTLPDHVGLRQVSGQVRRRERASIRSGGIGSGGSGWRPDAHLNQVDNRPDDNA